MVSRLLIFLLILLSLCLLFLQPLSVLGTPEFMAPELYDENYNEKIDIYAYGMLLLEIITRDVPYHECSNPAQIYKKVTRGIPPASLRRLKSVDARNFILLCLGIGEDASTRPSATDLLKHEFLAKRADDEDTIEVEPAVEDMVIEEGRCSMTFSETGSDKSSSGAGKGSDQNNKFGDSIDGHQIPSIPGKPPRPERKHSFLSKSSKSIDSKEASVPTSNTEDDEGDDHFGEMPENEANLKKVTVLMGRGTVLDDGDPPAQEMAALSTSPVPATVKTSMRRTNSEAETTSSLDSTSQFKVTAAVEEPVDGAVKPYTDDEINLVLTLPDEAQTRIEFDFDLVNDDPVQVAREMVTELEELPRDAVLDISGAISGVARQARMKQNQWSKLQQQPQQQQQQQQNALAQQQQQHALQHQQQQQNALAQQHALQHQQQQQQGMMMHPQGSVMPSQGIPSQGIPMMPQQHINGSGYAPPPAGNYQNPTNTMAQPAGSLAQPHLAATGNDPSVLGLATTALHQQQSQSQLQPSQPQHNHVSQIPPAPPQPTPMSTPQMPNQQPPSQMSTPNPQQHQMQHVQQQVPPSSPAPMPQASTQQYPPQVQQPTMTRSNSMEISPVPTQPRLPRSISSSSQEMIAPRQLAPPPVSLDTSTTLLPSQNQKNMQGQSSSLPQQQKIQMPLNAQPQVVAAPEASANVATNAAVQGLGDEVGEADTEEIRKLEQEFEKKMQRAQKSYGTRMDNLHRSREEAEAQHQMTLEKHEKELVEFEKRIRLGEEEQTRRLNQIQKEFIANKQEVRQQCVKQTSTGLPPLQNGAGDNSRPPLHSGGHKRSSSHFDSSMAATPHPSPLTDHKRNSSESDIPADAAAKTLMEQHQQQQSSAPNRTSGLPPTVEGGATPRDRSGSTSS